ncbi:MAG: hypothetical protein H7231_02610, partial [Rhodoferax sp.]|nr:hypothetical protein [Actinomycetota bacterium]
DSGADLRAELTAVVAKAESALKLRPRLVIEGPVEALVPPDLWLQLLAVLSEALSNVARHAGAGRVEVRVRADDDLLLTVTDDGAGIPADVCKGGLRNMRERAQARGGTFEARPAPGGGTVVSWRVPLRADSRSARHPGRVTGRTGSGG